MDFPERIHRSTITANDVRSGVITATRIRRGVITAHPRPRRRGTEITARDIARSAYEDVIGPHTQAHRKETP